MSNKKNHETQPEEEKLYTNENEKYFDEHLRSIQNIEGGGPLRKVDLNSMPRPLKIFGYFFIAFLILMFLAVVVSSVLR